MTNDDNGYVYLLTNGIHYYIGSHRCLHQDYLIAAFDGYMGSAKLGSLYKTKDWDKKILGFSSEVYMLEDLVLGMLNVANDKRFINIVSSTGVLFNREPTKDEITHATEIIERIKYDMVYGKR